MKNYTQFINEGVRDLMTGKSKESILKSLEGLEPLGKLYKIYQNKAEKLFSNEELKELFNELPPTDRLDKIIRFEADKLYTNEEFKDIFKNFTPEEKVKKGAECDFLWAVINGLEHAGKKYKEFIDIIISSAATNNNSNIIKYIVDNNEIIDIKSINNGLNRLRHSGKTYVQKKIAKLLTDKKLEILQKSGNPNELLLSSCDEDNYELAKLAIDKGADVNYNNKLPLRKSVWNNNTEITKLLLDNGAIVDDDDDDDYRQNLYKAIDNNNTEITKLLLNKGAPVAKRCINMAIWNNNIEILKTLEEHNIDILSNTVKPNDILGWIRKDKNIEVINYLLKKDPKLKKIIQDKINVLNSEIQKYNRHL
jgi:ankyrin repeat protein